MKKCKWPLVNACECNSPFFYRDGIFKLVPNAIKCIGVLGSELKNNDIQWNK
jgi:hypothetical protein